MAAEAHSLCTLHNTIQSAGIPVTEISHALAPSEHFCLANGLFRDPRYVYHLAASGRPCGAGTSLEDNDIWGIGLHSCAALAEYCPSIPDAIPPLDDGAQLYLSGGGRLQARPTFSDPRPALSAPSRE